MKEKRDILIFLVIHFSLGIFFSNYSFAQDLESICFQLTQSNDPCVGKSSQECKILLEECSNFYDQKALEVSKDLEKTSQQKETLSNEIANLKKKIKNLEYQINQSTLKAKGLAVQIENTQTSIEGTSFKIKESQEQIANILRIIYEETQKPLLNILIEGNLSNFFNNLVYLENLNLRVSSLLNENKKLKNYLEEQKNKMDEEVSQLQKTIALQAQQKGENEKIHKQQEYYLSLTEAEYQKQLQEKKEIEKKSARIKALLFQLIGVEKAPTFGESLEVAKLASSLTGVRTAFLLAIISQESAIGRNVGQCVLTNLNTGEGKKISTGQSVIRVMKPDRDIPIFLEITNSLGKDPYNTPVSCWIPAYVQRKPYGWGGAMGPAQFIPSTWRRLENRVKTLLNLSAVNPWAIRDSFVAAALYLSDLGASAQTLEKEKIAAGKYFGDSSYYYIQSVIKRADCIQNFIDTGTMSSYCESLIF